MEALLLIYVGLLIWVIVICVQKGKPGMAWLGLLWGWTIIIGAVRIAKPNSTWARKNYPPGGQKMAIAMARFPEDVARIRVSSKGGDRADEVPTDGNDVAEKLLQLTRTIENPNKCEACWMARHKEVQLVEEEMAGALWLKCPDCGWSKPDLNWLN
jgi:hypothetical protein